MATNVRVVVTCGIIVDATTVGAVVVMRGTEIYRLMTRLVLIWQALLVLA